MTWSVKAFREVYRRTGTVASSNSYVTYLNRLDAALGGLDEMLARQGAAATLSLVGALPGERFGSAKRKSDSLSALRSYLRGRRSTIPAEESSHVPDPADAGGARRGESMFAAGRSARSHELTGDLLDEIRDLACRYRRATGKPLGVTGEVAELTAARLMNLRLCDARTPGYDALDNGRRVQIKGRAVAANDPYRGRCPAIKCGDLFDEVLLVLLDQDSLLPLEIWRADEATVAAKLAQPGSKARNERASLAIAQFKSLATLAWPVGERQPA